jgi:hypothetical protein
VETIVAVAATIKTNAADIKTNTAAATADTIKIIEISQNLKETATIVEFMDIKRLNAGKRDEIMAAAITAAEIEAITAAEIKAITAETMVEIVKQILSKTKTKMKGYSQQSHLQQRN